MPHIPCVGTKLQTVVETSHFSRKAQALLTAEQRIDLINYLAANPEAGDVIPETNGVRKARFGAKGKGKSGGVRVIYYYLDDTAPLFALLIYGKGEKTDLSSEERKAVAALATAIKQGARAKRSRPD